MIQKKYYRKHPTNNHAVPIYKVIEKMLIPSFTASSAANSSTLGTVTFLFPHILIELVSRLESMFDPTSNLM